ncbi:MAG: hypothetical protein LAP87_24715 [Acidobacteriia bacterium]|nr:hypothetical protein [Terriglobia bacterium]
MNARILTTATLFTVFAGGLTARAADSQLVGLVMPDAKVIAGVNVDQAKASPFGQYVLTQMQSTDLQQMTALTGFDPTRDVHELLVASSGPTGQHDNGLAVARGNFDISRITAAATAHGATTESYNGVTIIVDPKKTHGLAFLDSTLVVAGDLANVKAAIDRPKTGSSIPTALAVQVDQWSNAQDAWVISAVPPYTLHPPSTAVGIPGVGPNAQNAFGKIEQAAAGVKFGALVVVTAQAQADTPQDATTMGDALKLLSNLALMQAGQQNPQLAALVQSLSVTTQGNLLKVTFSLPEDQLQQLVKPPHQSHIEHRPAVRHM